jgi:mono/diheme cytochrome c family protein
VLPHRATSARVFLLSAVGVVMLAGCGGEAQRVADGKMIYGEHCSTCHQPDGEGYAQVYPNLAGNPIVRLPDPAPVLEIVTHGSASMPGFAAELSPSQIAEVVSYVRDAWGNDASPVSAAQSR